MRQILKEIDIDTDNRMSFLEFMVWKYNVNVDEMMERPQGLFYIFHFCFLLMLCCFFIFIFIFVTMSQKKNVFRKFGG